jgi:hypothetical protein
MIIAIVSTALALLGQNPVTEPTEPPIDVTVCDLVVAPERYDGKRVRVRGAVNHEFENISLDDSICGPPPGSLGVWVHYEMLRGRSTEIAASSANRTDADTNAARFVERLEAARLRSPNSAGCTGRACYLYDVSATLVGVFKSATDSDLDETMGFGHLGCCHLLVADGVELIDATRTEAPAGGTFACRTDKQVLSTDLSNAWRRALAEPDANWNTRGRYFESVVAATAEAVGEPFSHQRRLQTMWLSDDRQSRASWISDDLRLVLTLTVPEDVDAPVSVERERCGPVTPPLPGASDVTCRKYQYGPFFPGAEPPEAASTRGGLHDAAPALLGRLVDRRVLPSLAGVALECEDIGDLPEFHFGSCVGVSNDGLVGVTAAFHRPTSESDPRWITARATVDECRVTPP